MASGVLSLVFPWPCRQERKVHNSVRLKTQATSKSQRTRRLSKKNCARPTHTRSSGQTSSCCRRRGCLRPVFLPESRGKTRTIRGRPQSPGTLRAFPRDSGKNAAAQSAGPFGGSKSSSKPIGVSLRGPLSSWRLRGYLLTESHFRLHPPNARRLIFATL